MAKPFFTYILRCADGSYYSGSTDELEKRIAEHKQGEGCTWTSAYRWNSCGDKNLLREKKPEKLNTRSNDGVELRKKLSSPVTSNYYTY